MQSSKRQRNRGFLLTDIGRLKLEAARQAAEKLDNQGERYTIEQLSQRTGLDLSTITRVLNISTRVDRRTLERFFQGFNLELKPEDFFKPKVESNFQLPKDSVVTSVPIYYPVTSSAVYGRERELEQLKNYLLKPQSQRDRTIILYGIGGVGKTAVAVKLVDEVKDDFEFVMVRSLSTVSSLPQVLSAILQYFSLNIVHEGFETRITRLITFMQQRRCLLVFDNVETILDSQSCNKSEHSYEAFFSYLSTTIDRSCIILISRVRLNTITSIQSRSLLIESLNTEAGRTIIRDRGIVANDEILDETIKLYDAHPLSLNLAATTILDIFNGDVGEFLAQKVTFFREIEEILEQQLKWLSEGEISTLYWLAVNGEPISLGQLREDIGLTVSSNQIVGWLRELRKHILIEKVDSGFTLQPLLRKYIINYLVRQTCWEIEEKQVKLLTTNALMKATAPDFIRQQQIEFILKPIIERLLASKGRDRLLSIFSSLLNRQRSLTPRKPGYLAGNIFNLLRHLETNLYRWDFSSLSVWQADGRGINLRQCNFAFADLAQSKFTEDFGETLSLAVNPDGEQLAACDTNGQIRLWRLKDKRQQLTLRGHSAWTQAIAFSPDGQTLASCSSDGEVRLWDINSGRCLNILKSHQGRLKAIVFTSDGETLASGGDEGVIKLWDINTHTVKQTLSGHTDKIRSIIISPDGKTLVSSSDDGSIRFWCHNGKCLRTIKAHQKPVWTIAFSPNGSLIASGSVDNTVKLWDSNTGELITTFKEHQGTIASVAFSPDGNSLASASYDRTVRLWDVKTKQQLTILPHSDWVQSVVFTDLGQTLISTSRDRHIKYWNVSTQQVQTTILSYSNGLWAIAISPDQKQLASTSDEQTIQLWNVAKNKIDRVLTGHNKNIWSVAYSPDNRFLASASDDRTVRIWDALTGKLHHTIQGDTWFWTVAFSPDSRILASSGADCRVLFWDVATGKTIQTFIGHTKIIRNIAFDPQGKYLASGGLDNTARVWHKNTGKCISIFTHPSPVSSVAFSPKRSILATGSDDNIVRLWELKTGRILQSFNEHTGWVQSVAFSPDGKILASGSHDGTIKLWQVGQKQATVTDDTSPRIRFGGHVLTLTHGGWIRALAFRICPTNGQLQLFSGSGDGTIKLWDVNSRNCIKTLSPSQPYSQMNITGTTGLSASERATLLALGAIETDVSAMDNVVYLRTTGTTSKIDFG